MLHRQRGVLNLFWVAVGSAVLALVAMAALFSMRYERNLFAEGAAKVGKLVGASPVAEVGKSIDAGAPLRKCVINGRTVVSNTDCVDANPTSKTIAIHDSRGIESPKPAPLVEQAPTSNPMVDKIIEKQLR